MYSAELNNDNKQTLHKIQMQAAREAYAYLCWLPMTKSKSIVNITKRRESKTNKTSTAYHTV